MTDDFKSRPYSFNGSMDADLDPCPVCGHRVTIVLGQGNTKMQEFYFSHHGGPKGFCILEIALRHKKFHNYDNMVKLWNMRGQDCEDDSISMLRL